MKSIRVYEAEAKELAPKLVSASIEFTVTPLPYGQYDFTVKDGDMAVLDKAVTITSAAEALFGRD